MEIPSGDGGGGEAVGKGKGPNACIASAVSSLGDGTSM